MSITFNTSPTARGAWRLCAALALSGALAACGGGESGNAVELSRLEVGSLSIADTAAPVYVQSGENVRLQTQGQATFQVATTVNGLPVDNAVAVLSVTPLEWNARILSPAGATVVVRVLDPQTGRVVAVITIGVVAPYEPNTCSTWQDARQQYFCEKAAYEAARDSANPVANLTEFLRRYPQSVWKNNAIFDRDRQAFRQAQTVNTVQAYWQFMQTYPNVGYSPFFGNALTEYNECVSVRGCRRTQIPV